MTQPTLEQLQAKNPIFFRMKQDRAYLVNNDRLTIITEEGDKPVYLINPDLSLTFERHL